MLHGLTIVQHQERAGNPLGERSTRVLLILAAYGSFHLCLCSSSVQVSPRWLAKSFDTALFAIMLLTIAYAIDRKKQLPFGGILTRTMFKFDRTLSSVEVSLLLTKPEVKEFQATFCKEQKVWIKPCTLAK